MLAPIVADVARLAMSYFTDPWCPWSWAAEPSLRRLQAEFGDQLAMTYVIGGLGGAAPDPREWLEAAAASGMPVDPRALLGRPPISAQPAGLAVKAVAEQADPGPFLRRLREAVFVERRTPDRGDALLELARETRPALDLDRLQIAFGSHGPVEALGADLELARERSLPRLRLGDAEIDGRAAYANWRTAALAAGAESPAPALAVEPMLRRFGPAATPEVAAVCDLPGPRAPAELWRLALEFRVRPRPVLGGELWLA
jgi:hypothetical protein